MRMDSITLVGASAPRGVFDTSTPSQIEVPCMVKSVTRSEAYQAYAVGLNPNIVFELAVTEDYNGEKTVLYNDTEYRVIRTFQKDYSLELICEQITYNRGITEVQNDQNQSST